MPGRETCDDSMQRPRPPVVCVLVSLQPLPGAGRGLPGFSPSTSGTIRLARPVQGLRTLVPAGPRRARDVVYPLPPAWGSLSPPWERACPEPVEGVRERGASAGWRHTLQPLRQPKTRRRPPYGPWVSGGKTVVALPCLPLTPTLSHQGRGRNHPLHGSYSGFRMTVWDAYDGGTSLERFPFSLPSIPSSLEGEVMAGDAAGRTNECKPLQPNKPQRRETGDDR